MTSNRSRTKKIGDLMIGKDHKSTLLVITDKATLITMIEKLKGETLGKVAKQY